MCKGLIQVYTGDGKGKTTAAIGCAVRAAGAGLKVCIIQFMKKQDSGELKILEGIENIEIKQFGTGDFLIKDTPSVEDYKAAEAGLEFFKDICASGVYDLIVLDEINVVVDNELIRVWEVVEAMENKPAPTELILTGRGAHEAILKTADLVTEMLEIKHHFNKGIKARKGIEY